MDNNMSTAINKIETTPDMSHVVVVHEAGADKPYKLEDAELTFDIGIAEDGVLKINHGTLTTSYFIQNTELDNLETWRFYIKGVKLKEIKVSAHQDKLTYLFEAEDFVDYTVVQEEDNG